MSDFSADWLQLREAADSRARSDRLLAALQDNGGRRGPILDLGAGTGSNLRHLAPMLGRGQLWRCIDEDAELLSQLPDLSAAWAQGAGYQVAPGPNGFRLSGPNWDAQVTTQQCNLAEDQALEPIPAQSLITASALLDLVSEPWLMQLIKQGHASGSDLFFALSYDGRIVLTPSRAEDQEILGLVNRHQRGDKGFGAALGPTASEVAERLALDAGYWARSAASDWRIGPDEAALQAALLDGWLEAALELASNEGRRLLAWRQARQRAIDAGELQILVGHRDLIARA